MLQNKILKQLIVNSTIVFNLFDYNLFIKKINIDQLILVKTQNFYL